MAKLSEENAARVAKGGTAIAEEELLKQFRPLPVPHRLSATITSGQINTYSQYISQFCAQSLAKLFIAQSLQNAKESKEKK